MTSQGHDQRNVYTAMDMFAKAKEKTIARYDKICDNTEVLSNDKIIDVIFDTRSDNLRRQILGPMGREEFNRKFESGTSIFKGHVQDGLDSDLIKIFLQKSFPETYFHPQIALVLVGSGKLTVGKAATKRITETGMIILAALESLPMMLAIGTSHAMRTVAGKAEYNEDTVEFTLLTFSYFGAKKCKIKEDDWFFYWKVFGSLMGLPPTRLHSSYDQAGQRMKELHKQCPETPDQNSAKLLDTFIQCFLETEDDVRQAYQADCISKRLRAYLKSKKRWPLDLPQH
jgi:hypothetical protein